MRSDPVKPSQNHAVDVERVLQTASSLFATFGYDGVGTREIARGSGCHVPSLYYHFNSKENLYREMFDERWEDLVSGVEQAVDQAGGATAQLRAFIDTFYDNFRHDRELLVLLMRDVINAAVAPPRYLSGRGHAYLLDLMVRLLSAWRRKPIDAHTAFTAMSLIFGYCCGLQLSDDDRDGDDARKQHLYEAIGRMVP